MLHTPAISGEKLLVPKFLKFLKFLFQAHMKCIVDQYDRQGKRFKSADDAPDTSYYQWVVFVFAFQVTFCLGGNDAT